MPGMNFNNLSNHPVPSMLDVIILHCISYLCKDFLNVELMILVKLDFRNIGNNIFLSSFHWCQNVGR
jgi:hypothetical protein